MEKTYLLLFDTETTYDALHDLKEITGVLMDKKMNRIENIQIGNNKYLLSKNDVMEFINFISGKKIIYVGYNVGFDINTLKKNCLKFGIEFDFDNIEFIDCWFSCLNRYCRTKKYHDFCKKNDYVTPTGYPKSNQETMYKYLTGESDFIQTHNACDDVENLIYIFNKIKQQKKKIVMNKKGGGIRTFMHKVVE